MFKESFKFYKAKWPIPDFTEVIDFDRSFVQGARQIDFANNFVLDESPLFGLKPVDTWRCYEVNSSGLIFIRNPFTVQGQRYWVARSLKDYPRTPNVVNLSTKMFNKTVIDDWWHAYNECNDKEESQRMKTAMRWTTLGFHHDWDTKEYSEKKRNAFPKDLAKLCSFFSQVLGFGFYSAEAAIVNYYPIGTTLAGHTDHSESDLEAPLFSFSFGQTAIFLIGGETKEEKPTAIFLQSGDVVIMSKSSRLCYHAVPRVMKSENENWNELAESKDTSFQVSKEHIFQSDKHSSEWSIDKDLYEQCSDENFWRPFRVYLNDSRININVRQVLIKGETSL